MKSTEEKNEEFVLNILHDIKSPIAGINIALENLNTNDIKANEILNEIHKVNKHNLEYIENLLENYSIKTGKYQLKQEYFSLINIINEEIFALKFLILEKNLKLNLISNNPNIFLNCDKQMIRQTFLNLLTNAVKYSPSYEEIKIEVSKLKRAVVVCVTNVCSERPARQAKGTGFGEKIIKNAVSKLNGKIYHTRNKDKICFSVELPV